MSRPLLRLTKFLALGSAILLLQSCLYIPIRYTYREQPEIDIGRTTKEDILLGYGNPRLIIFKNKFIYSWPEYAGVFVVFPLPGGKTFSRQIELHIEFDDNDIVKTYEKRGSTIYP